MKQLPAIKTFTFDLARYQVSDGKDDQVLLVVNYKDNMFEIRSLGSDINTQFRKQLAIFAKDLLKRKHGINFANSQSK